MRSIGPVPPELLASAALQEGLVSARQCDEAGLGHKRRTALLARGQWRRVARGVFDTEPFQGRAPDAARRRSAWLALLAYGPTAVAVGKCALALHGIAGLPTAIVPEAAVRRGRDRRDRDSVRLREFDNGMETVVIAGRRVATVTWALAQAVPELPREHAVATMDSALHLGAVDADGLDRAHRLARGRRGVAKTHAWWSLADPRAESPLETFARLDCLDAHIPPEELQVELFDDDGQFLGRGDLGWRIDRRRWLLAEIDGKEFHEAPSALLADRQRQNRLLRVADVLRFTAEDLRVRGRVAATIRSHLRRTRGCRPQTAD